MENQKMLSTQEPVVGGTENTLILGFSRHRFSRAFREETLPGSRRRPCRRPPEPSRASCGRSPRRCSRRRSRGVRQVGRQRPRWPGPCEPSEIRPREKPRVTWVAAPAEIRAATKGLGIYRSIYWATGENVVVYFLGSGSGRVGKEYGIQRHGGRMRSRRFSRVDTTRPTATARRRSRC